MARWLLNNAPMKLSGRGMALSLAFPLLFCTPLLPSAAASADLQQSQRGGATLQASFQYLLSDFSGPVPSQWARLDFDPRQRELYTLSQGTNEVRIYNRQGMEVFAFGGDGEILAALDIASGDNGEIYILSRIPRRNTLQVFNFRGEPQGVIAIRDLPEPYRNFTADHLEYQDGLFYLIDAGQLQIVVVQADGTFRAGHDLATVFERLADEQDPEKKKSLVHEITGFGVGADGSIYVTAATLFSAFRINPDGSLDSFGASGSGPGKFGVVAGICTDSRGNIFIADRLRSVVMVFSPQLVFQGEFGYRGDRPEDLIVPDELAVDPADQRIFVAQAANKGVGVYAVVLGR